MSGWALLGLLVAVFVVWHFLPDAKPPRPSPRFKNDLGASADDPQWRKFFEEHCESPAETAFLTAMIDAHELLPESGSLRSQDLKLDLQVQEGGYRVDFLANEWLVIEIDGAAYHSSEDAKERDRQRDSYFEYLGYSVLRVPAKIVFTDPEEAIRRVASALAAGRRSLVPPEQASGFERLGNTMSGLGQAMEEINANVSRQRAINAALDNPRQTFSFEKTIIDSAIASAVSQMKIELYVGGSAEKRETFDRHSAELAAALGRYDAENSVPNATRLGPGKTAIQFLPPPSHEDAGLDASIKTAYSQIEKERMRYLEETQKRIRSDPQLGQLIKDALSRMNYPEIWVNIA